MGAWIAFNVVMATLMGVYHQGGVVPAQMWIERQATEMKAQGKELWDTVVWWKAYSPPIWLLNGHNDEIITRDTMGLPAGNLTELLLASTNCSAAGAQEKGVLLVAPLSATHLDQFRGTAEPSPDDVPKPAAKEKRKAKAESKETLRLRELYRYSKHLNLDDMDFADDGVQSTLGRVVGRRGLAIWQVEKHCEY